jgi:Leucine-rich repeat (LRR) protein
VLNLAHNQVSDLTPLMNSRSLRTLILAGNPCEDAQLERLKRVLPKCEVVYR